MQALNTLATPEEKLAALCKKYADLVSRKSDTPTLSRYSHHLGAGDRKHRRPENVETLSPCGVGLGFSV